MPISPDDSYNDLIEKIEDSRVAGDGQLFTEREIALKIKACNEAGCSAAEAAGYNLDLTVAIQNTISGSYAILAKHLGVDLGKYLS